MIVGAAPVSASAICEQPKAQLQTTSKRRLTAKRDETPEPEPR